MQTPNNYSHLFILLSAGPSRRMEPTKESKYLLSIKREPLITRQIRIIEDVYPNAKIHIGLGESHEEIKNLLPKRIKTTICKDFNESNSCSTLRQILLKEPNKYKLTTVICGDILFNHAAIENITGDEILVTTQFCKDEDVGCNLSPKGTLDYLHFKKGQTDKFAQIFTFKDSNYTHILNCLATGDKSKWFLHELLNNLIEDYFIIGYRKK
jgi:hypothetical protein